ncbi:MAG TPA: outer membrane protein [Pseudolabrys sp.]|nr:outer membrane protein [Pseudolabrys sp.]
MYFLFEDSPRKNLKIVWASNWELGALVRKVLFALALTLAMPTLPAFAADLPVKAPANIAAVTNWTGFYIGIEGGADWGRFSQTNTISGVSLGFFDQKGGLIGGTAGYNWQTGNWIFGLETDLSWTDLSGTQACGPTLNFICTTEMRSFGTLRGRLGTTVLDNVMLYLTGGLAYGDIRATRNVSATVSDNWRAGWTLGGGGEMMLLPNWSVKLEYLYATFPGTATTYLVTSTGTPVAAVERDVQIVRIGLNWHL